MSVVFYWGSGSPYAWRVHQVLECKGIPYESRLLSFSKGEHKAPDYVALNPRGKVPTLVDGDLVLYESAGIARYLDGRYDGPSLFGDTPTEIGRIASLISEVEAYVDAAHAKTFRPLFFGRTEGHEDAIRAGLPSLLDELQRWEDRLAGKAFLLGDTHTAADIWLMPSVQNLFRAAGKPTSEAFAFRPAMLTSRYPNLARWKQTIEVFDWFARTIPPHWKE